MGMYAPITTLNKNFRLKNKTITDGGEEFFNELRRATAPTGSEIVKQSKEIE